MYYTKISYPVTRAPMTERHIILKKNIYFQAVEQEEEHLWNNERPIRLRMGFWACWRFGDHCPATISSVYLIIRFPPCGQRHRVKFIKNCAGCKSLAGYRWSGKSRKNALIVK